MSEKSEENNVDFVIDLRQIDGDGDFLCPKCKSLISPDDTSEDVYGELKAVVDKSGANLEAILLRCKKCKSVIKIIGFL